MRLLRREEDCGFTLKEFVGEDIPQYGILSHTWGIPNDEVTLKDLVDGAAQNKLGHEKVHFCATRCAVDHLEWFWIDTCCIDKTSSAELSEAINSMYQWYNRSTKCYVYLSDVVLEAETDQSVWELPFRSSRYFTRGWTLQELLAPSTVEFFSANGVRLGDKRSLGSIISSVTGISQRALQGTTKLYECSVTERLSWTKGRSTTKEEDLAYSLLGIFDVNMPLIYGEGKKKALTRLYRELRDSLPGEPPGSLGDQFRALGSDTGVQDVTQASSSISPDATEYESGSLITYTPCAPIDKPPIAVAFPSASEIDVVVLGDDSTLKRIRLLDGEPTTSTWQSDGKWFADSPLTFSRNRSRLEVIAPTPNGKVLYQDTRTGLLLREYWDSLGGTITGPLTAVASTPNRLDVFGLGVGGRVKHKILANRSWLPSKEMWYDLGGSFSLPPLVLSRLPGRFDLLCMREHDSALYHSWWDGEIWHPRVTNPEDQETPENDDANGIPGWAHRGYKFSAPPTAVATSPNRIDLFMLDHVGNIQHGIIQNNNWDVYWWAVPRSADQCGKAVFIGRPQAVLNGAESIDLFALRSDNKLHTKRFLIHDNKWDPPDEWDCLGGHFSSAPLAATRRSGESYVFCKGTDEEIHYMDLKSREWKSLGYPE
jgi:hypothetical protein